jgi:hypothetical protein
MPRARNPKLVAREEREAEASAERRKARQTDLVPRTATINLDELQVPEGAELPPRMAQVVALRLVGMTVPQIAEKLAMAENTVRSHLYVARAKGKLTDVGPILDHQAVPLAMENLLNGLEEGDKDYTLEVLKGRGAFRTHTHQASTGSVGPMHLQIQVELPRGVQGNVIDVTPGQVMGKPRE